MMEHSFQDREAILERMFQDVNRFLRNLMVGRVQYDEQAVIEAAMEVFWLHGYPAASVNQLTAATGLSRSSLYQRFKDKDGLFEEILSEYVNRVLSFMSKAEGPTMRDRLVNLLSQFIPTEGTLNRPPGCLLARCCSEIGELPVAARELVLTGVREQHALIKGIIEQAKKNGEIMASVDVEGMSWYYIGVLQAISNLPQAGATREHLKQMILFSMKGWP